MIHERSSEKIPKICVNDSDGKQELSQLLTPVYTGANASKAGLPPFGRVCTPAVITTEPVHLQQPWAWYLSLMWAQHSPGGLHRSVHFHPGLCSCCQGSRNSISGSS